MIDDHVLHDVVEEVDRHCALDVELVRKPSHARLQGGDAVAQLLGMAIGEVGGETRAAPCAVLSDVLGTVVGQVDHGGAEQGAVDAQDLDHRGDLALVE